MTSSRPPCLPGAEPCHGHPARPSGELWGAPAPLLHPTISGEGESQPMAKEGLQTPGLHGLLYPTPPNPSPLGQCELEGQLPSLRLGSPAQFSPVCTGARGVPAPPLTPRQPRACCSARFPLPSSWLLQASAALCPLVLEVMEKVAVGGRSSTSGVKQQRVLRALRGREKEHSGDAPGVGDATRGRFRSTRCRVGRVAGGRRSRRGF